MIIICGRNNSPIFGPKGAPWKRPKGSPSAQRHLTSLVCRYPLAVTKYRESERYSSSLYNQNDPWNPPVVFEEFLLNNENIENEVLTPSPPLPTLGLPHSCPPQALWWGMMAFLVYVKLRVTIDPPASPVGLRASREVCRHIFKAKPKYPWEAGTQHCPAH